MHQSSIQRRLRDEWGYSKDEFGVSGVAIARKGLNRLLSTILTFFSAITAVSARRVRRVSDIN